MDTEQRRDRVSWLRGLQGRAGAVLRAAFAAALVAAGAGALATQLPAGFQESIVANGLVQPTALRFASDGRVFIAEKRGVVKTYAALGGAPRVLIDIRIKVHNFWDRGLLGMALHPNYPATPYLYVLYTYDGDVGLNNAPKYGGYFTDTDPCPTPPGATDQGCVVSARLSRFVLQTDAAGTLSSGPEQVLIHDWCQQFPSHTIGSLVFGHDGALYVSAGDGAGFNYVDYGQTGNPCGDPLREGGALRSQDLRTAADPTTLDGSVLRLDPETAAALASNPLGSSADRNAARIVATGLRNPFRMALRPGANNELWIGDVGWNNVEEIDLLTDTTDSVLRNFGWPCYEGAGAQAGYQSANLAICQGLYASPGATTAPYFAYAHTAGVTADDPCPIGGSSVTGLAFNSGGSYPSRYNGALFFADHGRRCIWMLPSGSSGRPDPAAAENFAVDAPGPVDLQTGPGGDLFYVSLDTGTVRRILYTGNTNAVPTAVISAAPTNGYVPLTVSFDGSASSDPNVNDTLTYAWDLDGNGVFDNGSTARVSYVYAQAGTYTARLRVRDSLGAIDDATVTIVAGANTPPVATIAAPAPGTLWKVGDVIGFAGSASDAEDGTEPASRLSWTISLFHCATQTSCHEHVLQNVEGVASGSFVAPDHSYPSYLQLQLTARDAAGLIARRTVRLDPRTTTIKLQSLPSSLDLVLGAERVPSGTVRTVIVGSTQTISAPTPQVKSGTTYVFENWSDGGAQTHTIVAPATAATYTARYRKQ